MLLPEKYAEFHDRIMIYIFFSDGEQQIYLICMYIYI